MPPAAVSSPVAPARRRAARRATVARPVARGDKRDAILNAAIRVFAERGFFAAQVADVARVAGVAAGTVYLYFRGKDDLLVSIFERVMTAALEEGRAAIAGVTDPIEQLRRLARLHLERVSRDRHLTVVFQVELRQSTKFMERFSTTKLREYLGRIRDAVAAGQAAGLVRPDINPTLAAKMLFGALDEMATNWMLSKRASLDGVADQVVDIFVFGIGAAASAHTDGSRLRSRG